MEGLKERTASSQLSISLCPVKKKMLLLLLCALTKENKKKKKKEEKIMNSLLNVEMMCKDDLSTE
ncbi:hypothetical protein DKP78_17080, partial [Enterococcus faecium]